MKHLLKALGVAGLLALGSGGLTSASAQDFGVRIGPGGAAIDVDRPRRGRDVEVYEERRRPRDVEVYEDRRRPRVVEERVIRRPAARRTVCRTVVRERVRPNGVVVRRPTEVCRTVVDRY